MTKTWQTKLIHSDAKIPAGYKSLSATPTYRGLHHRFPPPPAPSKTPGTSTKSATLTALYGTPTALELAATHLRTRIRQTHHSSPPPADKPPSSLINLALLQAGDHILVPTSVYYPNRKLHRATPLALRRHGPRFTIRSSAPQFPRCSRKTPALSGPNPQVPSPWKFRTFPPSSPRPTRATSKSSSTNTWSAGVLFDAFAHVADITIASRHQIHTSAAIAICSSARSTVRDDAIYQRLGVAQQMLGLAVSPDDCSPRPPRPANACRPPFRNRTFRPRGRQNGSLNVLRSNSSCTPLCPSCPGHEFWKRDFFPRLFRRVFAGL